MFAYFLGDLTTNKKKKLLKEKQMLKILIYKYEMWIPKHHESYNDRRKKLFGIIPLYLSFTMIKKNSQSHKVDKKYKLAYLDHCLVERVSSIKYIRTIFSDIKLYTLKHENLWEGEWHQTTFQYLPIKILLIFCRFFVFVV